VRRKAPLTVLDTFDEPTMTPNCEARNCTTVAPQSLLLMNDNFVLDTSHALAEHLRKEAPGDARGQIKKAWEILYGNAPSETDLLRSLAYVAEQTESIRVYEGTLPPKPAPAPAKTTTSTKDATTTTPAPEPDPELEALASLCQVLYSSNRFLYIE
jgi:hypothetical protein